MATRSALNRLTVKHLRALAALDENVSLTRAADSLGLSQPALSNRLREIERLTRTQIFHRTGAKLSFTALGQVLLNTARIVLDELTQAESYLDKVGTSLRRTVRVEVRGYALHRWLAPFLAEVMTREPGLSIDLSLNAAPLPQQALLTGAADISIGVENAGRRGLLGRALFDDELVGILPADHALAGHPHLAAADFAARPFVTFSSALEKGQEVDRLFLPAGVVPQWVVDVGSSDAVCALIASGFGVGILSRWAAAQHPDATKLAFVPLTAAGLHVHWNAVVRQDAAGDPAIALVLARLAEWSATHGPGTGGHSADAG